MLEESFLKPLLARLLTFCFRVEVKGLEYFKQAGDRVLIICNHQSFLDPLLLAVLLPEKPGFAISIFQAEKWYLRWLTKFVTLYSLDPSKPISMKSLIQDLRKGGKAVLFPEGRITTTGGIMKIYEGAGLIVEKTGATVLPVYIDGAEYSKFSRMKGKLRQRWFPKITLTIRPPIRFPEGQDVTTRMIYDLMTDATFAAADLRRSLLSALLDAYRQHGGRHVVGSDIARVDMNYRQLFTRAFIMKEKLAPVLRERQPASDYVGVLLPTSLAAAVTFTALHMLGKIPCMLNFSAGSANLHHACRMATVNTILTSRAFIEKGKLEPLVESLGQEYRIFYLEDIRPTVTLSNKLQSLFHAIFARTFLQDTLQRTSPDSPAVILYTSGSEGTPKGVALSHSNLLANMHQACARLDLTPRDTLFNALPVFHSFGLTIGMLMPMVRGIKTFLYPTPLHYRVIPELVYDTDSTIMLGTDTFYHYYAHFAHDYDFRRVRLAVAGAEKLKETTRHTYMERFGVTIMEGYGVTEASPAIAFNTPLEHRAGSVGRAFPMIECRLDTVEGLEGGRLNIRGPNVMLGYLKADKPGVIQPQGDWYDTGDIVDIDTDGFIFIKGRAKRFAKIGGEMVSLQAVEDLASAVIPQAGHAAVAVNDDKKGEQVLLYTESNELTRDDLLRHAREKGIPELFLPRRIEFIEALPRLGTGKVDYPALSKLVSV